MEQCCRSFRESGVAFAEREATQGSKHIPVSTKPITRQPPVSHVSFRDSPVASAKPLNESNCSIVVVISSAGSISGQRVRPLFWDVHQ